MTQQLPDWLEAMVPDVAKDIAVANGDEFADALKSKDRWVAKRGMSGGRFRDINEPFQSDYLDMARAALAEAAPKIVERMAQVAEQYRFPDGWVGNDGQVIIANAIRREVNT